MMKSAISKRNKSKGKSVSQRMVTWSIKQRNRMFNKKFKGYEGQLSFWHRLLSLKKKYKRMRGVI